MVYFFSIFVRFVIFVVGLLFRLSLFLLFVLAFITSCYILFLYQFLAVLLLASRYILIVISKIITVWIILILIFIVNYCEPFSKMKIDLVSFLVQKIPISLVPWYFSLLQPSPHSPSRSLLQSLHELYLTGVLFPLLLFLILLCCLDLSRWFIVGSQALCTYILGHDAILTCFHVCPKNILVHANVTTSCLSHFLVLVILKFPLHHLGASCAEATS